MEGNIFVEQNDPLIVQMIQEFCERFNLKNISSKAKSDKGDFRLLVLTGGEDVHPQLYGEPLDPRTYFNWQRDLKCLDLMEWYGDGPVLGICRGSQFLNVMNGGKLNQHIEHGHGMSGEHRVSSIDPKYSGMLVSSTHHQEIIPAEHGEVILVSEEDNIVECVMYNNKHLCIQGHPEYHGYDQFKEFCFEYLCKILNLEYDK